MFLMIGSSKLGPDAINIASICIDLLPHIVENGKRISIDQRCKANPIIWFTYYCLKMLVTDDEYKHFVSGFETIFIHYTER